MTQEHTVVRMPRPPATEPRKKLTVFEAVKKLCQCVGLASLILVMNYGDLLGGGADVRMHVPFKLNGIVAAQVMDILLLGLVLWVILLPLSRTKFYPWVKLVLAVVAPPYLIWRMQSLFPDVMSDGLVPIIFAVWAAVVLLLLYRYLQERQRVNFPILPGDQLDEDLGLDSEDITQTVREMTANLGRQFNPGLLHKPLVTVEDLVRMLQASPRHIAVSEAA